MDALIDEISACRLCSAFLPFEPKPVFSIHGQSKILVVGQAPGMRVQKSGIPWDDKSGENLRSWMGIGPDVFYDASQIGIVPMGFCYPGKGKSGDLPPRQECAPTWHHRILSQMKEVKLTLLIGRYAQAYYLQGNQLPTLTETVHNYRAYLPEFFVLPHPSPRNNIWQARNPWFADEILPELKKQISQALSD